MLSEANRKRLRTAGVCIWLTASPDELHRRTQADARSEDTRPPLTEHSGVAEVRHLLADRSGLYAASAEHVLETEGRSVAEVVDAILALAGRAATDSDDT